MVCYCLDLRGDSKFGNFLGHKIISVLAAVLQLALWLMTLMNFIIKPDYVKERIENTPSGALAATIIIILIIIGFSGLLLFGLLKDRAGFIKSYLIFNMVLTVLFVLGFFVNLFTQPGQVGVGGFIGVIFIILLNVLFFFIVRNYYLAFTTKKNTRNPA